LLSDTVGFIRKLPHHLIESFKSTLDEVRESDILLHVVDIAHSNYEEHIHTVNETLKGMKIGDKPTLLIFNKIDLYRKRYFDDFLDPQTRTELEENLMQNLKHQFEVDNIFISAQEKENIEVLKQQLKRIVEKQYQIRYPYQVKTW
ncbi:MAG: GTPase HflX, partial [Saprospiraceae bacterium]|nr:GTPase HflX [Saprospiraceae bacterium]